MTRNVDYDVVVIGAGLGGLSAASTLAQGGLSVLVVERHDKPGGYATSFARQGKAGVFRFDVSLHLMDAVMPGEPNRALVDAVTQGGSSPLTFRRPEVLRREIWSDLDIRLPHGTPQIIDALSVHFPHERSGLERFTALARAANDAFHALELGHADADGLLAPLGDLGRRTAEDVIAREIGDSRLRALLGEFALGWLGLPASLTSAIPFLVAWASYHHYGGAYPDGGSEALSRAIADSIEAHGGTIRLGCAAARIVVRRRKVEAVELADGRIVTTRFVVSNANPLHTFGELVDQAELDQGTLARIRRMEPSMSAVKVWLGLSGGLPAGAPLDYDTYLNGAFGPVADEPDTGRISVLVPENIHRSAGEGLVSANPSSKVILTMLVPPRHLPEHASTDFKRRAGDTLVRRVEESLFPGLASRIDVMEIGAPETFARFTGNPGGSIYGWAPRPNQLGRLDPITAIDGLSLASAWTPPGGGFTSTLRSGQRAGRRLVGQLTGRLPKRTP